jgi:hypothetical protein
MNDKRNNLFIFGDSFSTPTFEHLGIYDKLDYEIYHWFELVSKEFDLNFINKAKGGSSNQEIIDTFLLNFNEIRPNDVVIIGSTVLSRIIGYNKLEKKVTTINNDYFFQNKNGKSIKELIEITDEYQDSQIKVIDFMYDNILNHENEWGIYYNEKFKNLLDICLKQNIKCYFWTYECWDYFSSHRDEGLCNDSHFGVEGNKYFSKYMIHRIKNNDFNMNISPKEFGNKK